MPTPIDTTSNSYNIDYYFVYYNDHYSISFLETKPEKVQVLSTCFNSEKCDSTKKYHYIRVL